MIKSDNKDEFVKLVQANHKNRHQAVLRAACELFIGKENTSRIESLHFEELFLRLFPKLDQTTKADLSEKLSTCPYLPRAVAMLLAKDDIAVSAPLLRYFPNFTDDDLLMILAEGNEMHALAISSRRRLADEVTLALSKIELPAFVAEEDEQPINETEMEIAMPDIEARNRQQLNAKKAAQAGAEKLQAFLTSEHAHVLTYLHKIESTLQEIETQPEMLLKQAYRRAEKGVEFTKLARKRNALGFAKLLAEECNLEPEQTKDIIRDPNGFALAVCLKSLALPPEVAMESFLLLNSKLGQDTDQIFLLQWFYNQITPMGANTLVAEWQGIQVRPSRIHQPMHDGEPLATTRRRPSNGRSVNKPAARPMRNRNSVR